MEPLIVLFGVASAGALAWAWRHQQRVTAEADAAWARAAAELGATFSPHGSDWFHPDPRRIVATIEGVTVEIDHHETGGKNRTIWTRACAPARAASDLSLEVTRTHALSALGAALGFQDVEIGDRGFDDAFTIKSSDPDVARVWLNRAVRERISALDGFAFRVDKGRVVVETAILLRDPARLAALARAAAVFADGTRQLRRTWRGVARSLGGTVKTKDDRPTLTADLDGVPIEVTVVERGEGTLRWLSGSSLVDASPSWS